MEMLPIPSMAVTNVSEPPNPDTDGIEEEMDPCSVSITFPYESILKLL